MSCVSEFEFVPDVDGVDVLVAVVIVLVVEHVAETQLVLRAYGVFYACRGTHLIYLEAACEVVEQFDIDKWSQGPPLLVDGIRGADVDAASLDVEQKEEGQKYVLVTIAQVSTMLMLQDVAVGLGYHLAQQGDGGAGMRAKAHVAAMARVLDQDTDAIEYFNIGTGRGNSTLEIVETFEKATGVKLNWKYGPRREGDIEKIWGDCTKANKVLGWEAKTPLEDVLASAWKWQQKLREDGVM